MKGHIVTLQDVTRASPACGRKSTSLKEAKLSKPRSMAPSKAGELAAQQRRGDPRCRDSAALGDCTQALARLTPSQGMLPDGTAGVCPPLSAVLSFHVTQSTSPCLKLMMHILPVATAYSTCAILAMTMPCGDFHAWTTASKQMPA